MRFSAIVTVVCLSIAALSASADAEAHIKKRTDIPAQDLAPALQTLAKDHNFQIIYVSEELSDKRSQGAIGVFTADEALKSLLRGTGLTYRYLDENTVTILHDPAGGPSGAPISMSLREEKTPAEADLGDSSLKPAPENARFGQLRLAQASPQGGQAAAAKSSAFDRNASHLVQPQDALDEIIVTANKRKENLQNVPISIVSLTSERLESSGVQSTDDLSAVVPGLTMESNFSGFAPHLRGVGQTSTQVGNENSVAITVDGVYIANLNGALLDLASVDSIEVDKGPQGTLFGRNATGGAIIITTKDPTQEFHGTGSLTYGNYNTVETSDYVTGGITPILAADLAVYASHQGDGYGRNLYTGSEVQRTDLNVSARSKWKLTPTDVDTITLALDYEQMNSSALGAFRSLDQYTVGVTPPYTFAGRPWDIDSGFDPFLHMKQGGGSLRVKHDFEFATFNSISAYRQTNVYQGFSFTPAPTPYERPIWDNPEREITQELQIGSLDSSTIKWVAGLYYFNDKASYDPFSVHGDALFPIQLQFFSTVTDESEAAYGQVTVPIRALGDTNVTVGLRYTMEQRGIIGETNIAQDPSLGGGLIASTDPADTSKDFRQAHMEVRARPSLLRPAHGLRLGQSRIPKRNVQQHSGGMCAESDDLPRRPAFGGQPPGARCLRGWIQGRFPRPSPAYQYVGVLLRLLAAAGDELFGPGSHPGERRKGGDLWRGSRHCRETHQQLDDHRRGGRPAR